MKNKLVIIFCVGLFSASVQHSYAADMVLVREYIKKSEFRSEMVKGIKQLKHASDKSAEFDNFVDNINFASIEDKYAQALASHLSNDDIHALLKSLEIPGLQEAYIRNGQAVASVYEVIVKEMESAAKKAGIPIPAKQKPMKKKKR